MRWWKICFWIYAILGVLGTIILLVTWFSHSGFAAILSFANWFELVTSIIAVIGLYEYAYKKKILHDLIRKVFFWVLLVDYTVGLLYGFTPLHDVIRMPSFLQSNSITTPTGVLLTILFNLPVLYAFYKLSYPAGFGKKLSKKKH